ncbi:pullulanase [Paenibacillus sp. FSL H3-0469]|uniref:pullulanase n=1 Tax=Paenibacillus sp. FSL H3-0469 TaxID=2954506 RepID=UPI0031012B67
MRFAVRAKKMFTVLMVLALICSGLGIGPARVSAAAVKAVLVGDLQTKFAGLDPAETKDWNETSTVTEMTYKGAGLYIFSGTLPKGTYEYKVALNDSWSENYGYSSYTNPNGEDAGGNIRISLTEETRVTFYYNDLTKAIADSTYYSPVAPERLPRVIGSVQTALGDPAETSPADAGTLLHDADLDGVYEQTALLPAGDFTYQVYLPGAEPSAGTAYPEPAQELKLPAKLPVTFQYRVADHSVSALYTAPAGEGEVQPVPAGHLRVHYYRADGNYADLGLWTWGDVASPSADWPKGAVPFPAGQTDAYGAYVDLLVKDGAKSVSFLVVNRISGVKEMENGDKTFLIGTPQTNEAWIKEGSNLATPYEPVSLPENTVRIHYSRADNNQSQYGLWLWDDVASPSEGWPKGATPFAPEHKDAYGAYVDIPLKENAKTISFIVMKPVSGDKDGPAGNENKSFTLLDRYNQLWVKENDPNVYTSPFGETPIGLLSAEVLSAGKLVLGFTMTDGLDPAALKAAITVKDAEGTAIPVTAVTITGGGTLEVATGAFDLGKIPLRVTYAGTTVSASTGWRMLDEMYNYTGDDLGATYHQDDHSATLKLWAPKASSVTAVVYDAADADRTVGRVELTLGEKGVWSARLRAADLAGAPGAGDVRGFYYQYEVTNDAVTRQVLDPYAKSMAVFTVNTAGEAGAGGDTVGKAAIVDLTTTNPPDFKAADIAGYEEREDAVIYEAHIRDFTSDPAIQSSLGGERWGSYAAFAKKLDYIKSLGVTHIQLLPVMAWYYGDETRMDEREPDYSAQGNEYNWGYDPHSYFSPDGAYSQHPADPEVRIRELKGLIDAVHEAGMGVILDVVYTHMAKKELLNDIVPGYYAFQDAHGNFIGGFGNNLATSHKMAEKLMVDSVKYWFEEYKIDGMRWDMMGDATADAVQAAYDAAAAINPKALFIGEGWITFGGDAGEPDLKGKGADQKWMDKTDSVGVFSDEFRNELKSGFGSEGEPRFITGGARDLNTILNNIKAQPSNVPADDPGDMVPYIEAHDNLTLHDVIALTLRKNPQIAENELEIQKRIRLGNLLLLTSQGTAFLHAGQEYGRTKQWMAAGVPEQKYTEVRDAGDQSVSYFIHDSYDSSDSVNKFDWAAATDAVKHPVQNETRAYTAGLIQLRKSTNAFRLGDIGLVNANVKLIQAPEMKAQDLVIGYSSKATDGTGIYYVLMNGDSKARTLTLPEDLSGAEVLADSDQAGTQAIAPAEQSGFRVNAETITIDPLTSVILRKEAPAAVLTKLAADKSAYTLQAGGTHQAKVTATYDDGASSTVTAKAQYVSDKPEIVTVTSKGLIKGLKAGSATLTITYGGLSVQVAVEVTAPPADSKRYVQFTYTRPDKDYKDWSVWLWYTGATDGEVKLPEPEEGSASSSVLIEVGKEATRVGFVLIKGLDWADNKQDIAEDRYIELAPGELFTKVYVTSMVQELNVMPAIRGPLLQGEAVTFLYRDDELFRSGDMSAITEMKVKVNGTEYPMTYDPAKEWFSYRLEGLQEGTYKYSFLVTKDGVTRELTDPHNTVDGESVIRYHKPEVQITAEVSPPAVNFNENAVITVKAASAEEVSYTDAYLDLTELGGPAKVKLDTGLMQQTVSVKQDVTAGLKEIPVVLVDQYGNVHRQTAEIEVKARTYSGAKADFDWDEARIYFALTDRFKDGDPDNNENVDTTHPEAYHGGDFRGMIDNLDYLKELGINTLWITPVVDNIDFNQGVSFGGKQYAYHGYWAKDFTKLDEHLGDMDTFKELIDKAHDRGIKIMVDVVLNHTGYGLKESDEQSGVTAEDKARFAGMLRTDGVQADKDVIRGELSGLPDFRTEDPAVREKLIAWQTGWLDNARTERGDTIDYFRVDTVKHVEDTTWKAFKNALTTIDPSFKLVGEYFGGTADNDGGTLQSGQMDGLLDFGFKEQAKRFAGGSITAVDAYLQEREAKISNTRMMAQFLSSHDEDGFLSEYVDGDKGKLKVAAALQITAKGQPVVYYGEELGRSGKNAGNMAEGEFSRNRGDMPWDQLAAEQGLRDHYKKLLNIRANYSEVYARGTRSWLAGNDESGYLAFNKQYGKTNIVTVINSKAEGLNVEIPVPYAPLSAVKDEYSGKEYTVSAAGKVSIDLPGRDAGGTVILSAKSEVVVPTPTPTPTPAPTATATPAPVVDSGSTPVTTPSPSAAAVPGDTQEISEAQLSAAKDGRLELRLEAGKTAVLLPLGAASLLGKNELVIRSEEMSVTLPSAVLADAGNRVQGADAAGSRILLELRPLSPDAVQEEVRRLSTENRLASAESGIFELKLQLIKQDGTRLPVSLFKQPVTLTLKLTGQPVKDWTGVFSLEDGGALRYMGGAVQTDGSYTAAVTQSGRYAVLEVHTLFKDVPVTHWASAAITSLAAKQVVTGVNAEAFEPARKVTRAEFTALLMRALGQSGQGQTTFEDVRPGAWYASYVEAAASLGIVSGRSRSSFAPDAAISREEMAVMAVRALEFKQGEKLAMAAPPAGYADASGIREWAKAYVNAATALKLVEGREQRQFIPQGLLTRAESAQVIYNLLRQ